MFQHTLFSQFYKFSRENIWIYLVFLCALGIVLFTQKGNIGEIIIIFFLNIVGNTYSLLMQDSFKDKKFKVGVIFLTIGNIIYLLLSLYAAYFNQQYQYLLWQVAFQLSGLSLFIRYYTKINIHLLNTSTMFVLGLVLFFIGVQFLGVSGYALLQSFGFLCITVGISEKQDTQRYYIIFIGVLFMVLGSLSGLYSNFMTGSVLGITLSYTIISSTTLIYYIKILPHYIILKKHSRHVDL